MIRRGWILHEVQSTSALDLASDLPVQFGRNTGGATWVNLSGLRRELFEEVRVEVIHFIKRYIETATWHPAVGTTEIHRALFVLWSGHEISLVGAESD